MSIRFVIKHMTKGWLQCIDYDTNEPIFSPDAFTEECAYLFRTYDDAINKLSTMYEEQKNVGGAYTIEKILFLKLK
jgi:hypothetical protein